MNERVIGTARADTGPPLTSLELQLSALDLVTQWKRCGLTADFVAGFLSYAFESRDTARSVISTLVNELVENAAKFVVAPGPVRVSVRMFARELVVEIAHRTDAVSVTGLERIFAELDQEPTEMVYRRRLTDVSPGGLGLAMLARDYSARLHARLGPSDSDGAREVVLNVTLDLESLEPR